MSAQTKPDCHHSQLGLTPGQRAALTGFTHRAVAALAHLREAWCNADPNNRAAVEASIRALLDGHSMRDMRVGCADVLRAGLGHETALQLLRSVGLGDVVAPLSLTR
jgi:hypothetical protein